MEDYDNDSLRRCYNIIMEYGGIEEFLKRIEETVNDSYPKEQCYKDILKNSTYNSYTVQDFIRYIILSNNKEDIEIIVSGLEDADPMMFRELIQYLSTDKKCKEFLKTEIKKGLIGKLDLAKTVPLYNFLNREEDGKQIIEERFEDFLCTSCDFKLVNEIINEIGIPEERVIKSKTKILENAQGENIISFIKWLDERGVLSDGDISLEDFTKALHSDIDDETTLKMIEIIYSELMRKQNLSIKDIEILGRGAYSRSYKIGQFIFKIGDIRQTEAIPYHRRILQPIIRQDVTYDYEKELYIEIQNEVDNKWYENMTIGEIEEELYRIYKEMREDGVVWTDIKKENVGRLIRPNKTNYYTETLEGDIKDEKTLKTVEKELQVNDDSVGIFERKTEECLQPGELVILDTDYIFKEEDINIREDMKMRIRPQYIKFEKRYMEEKGKDQR